MASLRSWLLNGVLSISLAILIAPDGSQGFNAQSGRRLPLAPTDKLVPSTRRLCDRTLVRWWRLTELSSTSVQPQRNPEPTDATQILPAIAVAVQDLFRELDELYNRSSSIRCPFWRRRTADAIDAAAMVMRFLLIRHKSLGVLDPFWDLDDADGFDVDAMIASSAALQPPGCKAVGFHVRMNEDGTVLKNRHLDLTEIAETIRRDWIVGADGARGYYITGRLNSTIYTDDCLFDGPDPDMPVRGLRKYLSAASHLFDPKSSRAELLSLEWEEGGGERGNGAIEARWRLDGTLMLPWRPSVRPWTGMTRYHLDGDGLVYLHEESWDISVWEAFVYTVWPEVGEMIWGKADAGSVAMGDRAL